MGFSMVLPLVIWAVVAQVQITSTERGPFPAQVLAISDASVEVSEGNKRSQIATDKLRNLSFNQSSGENPKGTQVDGRNSALRATLVDGSTLYYRACSLSDGTAKFELGWGGPLSLPASSLFSIQFQPLSEPQSVQWQAIAQSRSSADLLVLIRAADALEKLEGVVSKVTEDAVSFDFGGQTIDAPRSKLAGVRFFSTTNAENGSSTAKNDTVRGDTLQKLTAIVVDQQGNRWLTSHIALARGSANLELQLRCGGALTLPLEQLREIDFSSGSMQFLAEMVPLSHSATGRFELGIDIAEADALFGARQRDLRRPGSGALGPSLEFLGSGVVEYRVPADFSRLMGAFELRPAGNRFTPCKVIIKLDGQTLWQERLNETGKVWPIDAEIKSDGRLRIEVIADAPTPVGDVVLCHDLRVVK